MIKAVIFDCFGVLTSDGWLPFKQKEFANDPEKFAEAGRINFLADSGKISKNQFVSQIAELSNKSTSEVASNIESNVSNDEIFGLILELKAKGYRIGMLSNVSGDWLDRLFNKEQQALFDEFALSYDTGVAKPEPRAYALICEKLECKPGETIFVDDQQRFVDGAQRIGMNAILYTDMKSLRREIDLALKMTDTDK